MPYTSTILIVDDDPSARDTLEALLTTQGYTLAFANNGKEALTKAKELMPDVIMLDIMMPDMDGFEVCRRLRADLRLAEVPVIMVTALDDQDSRLQGIEAGADDFVAKPFNRAELRARVKTITRLNRYRQLLAERTKFEWVIQQASDGYVMVDDADQVIYANPQARVYLGMPPELGLAEHFVLPQEKFIDLAQHKYRCEPHEAWAAWPKIADELMTPLLYLIQPESATAHMCWLQVDVLDLPAATRLLSGTDATRLIRLRDVSAQVSMQRDMWEFHSAINHKLRTPLLVMLNSLELQVEHGADLSGAQLAEMSEIALKSVNRLRGEIGDILQYLNASSLAEGGEKFKLSRLKAIVAEVSTYLEVNIVGTFIPPDLMDATTALSERGIELALWELAENAKKFHPTRSPGIEVAASRVGTAAVSLRVSDDGITLSAEQLTRAWIPYYQGEKYFTGQAAGMGLGLPMVASLVWSAGGTCRMYNRDGKPGVVVELILPLLEA